MSNEFLKAQIDRMDVKSDEFWDIYNFICNKYFNFDDPDDFQKSLMLAHMYLDRAGGNFEENVIAMVKIIEILHGMDPLKGGTAMANIGFK